MAAQAIWQEGPNLLFLYFLFYSGLSELGDALPIREGTALLTPRIQLLILSRNTLIDSPRNHVNQIPGQPVTGQTDIKLAIIPLYLLPFW